MPEEGITLTEKRHLMSIEEILEITKIFVSMGITKVRLTGGEPLIRKNIEFLLRELGKLPIELSITTNGIIVDKFIDIFKEVGLKKVNISLDSLNKEKSVLITKRDYQDKILSNINLLLKHKFTVKINVVLIRGTNDDELLDFIDWTKNKKLSLRFIEFMPFFGNKWDLDKGISLAETLQIIKLKYGNKVQKIEDALHDTTLNYKIEGFESTFGIISSVTNPFCSTCNRIRLTANGHLKNCLFSNKETDLLTPFRAQKDIQPIILESIFNKKKQRAGMDTLDKLANPELNADNRSMTAIGG